MILDPSLKPNTLESCAAEGEGIVVQQNRLIELHDLAACLSESVVQHNPPIEAHNIETGHPDARKSQFTKVCDSVKSTQTVLVTPLARTPHQHSLDFCATKQLRRDSHFLQLTEAHRQITVNNGVESTAQNEATSRYELEQHFLSGCSQIELTDAEPQLTVSNQHPNPEEYDNTVSRASTYKKLTSNNEQSGRRRSSIAIIGSREAPRHLANIRSVSAGNVNRGSTILHYLPECETTASSNTTSAAGQDSRTMLLSSSTAGVPRISVTLPQHELVNCEVIDTKVTTKNENSMPSAIISGQEEFQHAIENCASVPADLISKDDLNAANSNTPSKQHGLENCKVTNPVSVANFVQQHVLVDCDDEPASSTEQSDGPSDDIHFIPPPTSTPSTTRAFSPQYGRRTPSAAESALRSLLGNLGCEPLDGSSDMICGPDVAFDVGISAPAPSVGTGGTNRAKSKSRNRNRKQARKNRTLKRSDTRRMSSSSGT